MNSILPWLNPAWQKLIVYKNNNYLPQGILLTGSVGIGKSLLANEYARVILCQANKENPCGSCRSCILFAAGNHPDFFLIQGEEKSSAIKIEQIRELTEVLYHTSILGGFQVAILLAAENMNRAAANALLKTLEEPRGSVLILLVSHQPSAIAATVRSRCQEIKCTPPTRNQAMEWLVPQVGNLAETAAMCLSIADNLPYKALEYANSDQQLLRDTLVEHLKQIQEGVLDPISAAADCLTSTIEKLYFLSTLTADMIRVKFSANGFLQHQDKILALNKLCQNLSVIKLFKFLDEILEAIRLLSNRTNVNLQLLMEKIFINWRYTHDIS